MPRPDQAAALDAVRQGDDTIQDWVDIADEFLAEGSVHLADYAATMANWLKENHA